MSNQNPSKSIPPTLHTDKARQLYEKRLKEGRDGNAEQDWEEAQQYLLDHPQAIFLWRLTCIIHE
jgi:arylamine N-acetyltransferase